MADENKKSLNPDSLEVSELEDESLEGVTGGDPVVVNTAPHCGAPKLPSTTIASTTTT